MPEDIVERTPLRHDWVKDRSVEVRHPEQIHEIQLELRLIISQQFPTLAQQFQEPPFLKVIDHVSSGVGAFKFNPDEYGFSALPQFSTHADLDAGLPYYEQGHYDTAIPAAAVIRYIDNFIDSVLWPQLPLEPDRTPEFSQRFHAMLDAALALVQRYIPDAPARFFDIFRDEMAMGLDPSQETFDAHIGKVFAHKSFDLLYLDSIVNGYDYNTVIPDRYRIATTDDMARDFDTKDYSTSNDFNVFNFLRDHNLNSRAFLQEMLQTILIISPRTCAELIDRINAVDSTCLDGWSESVIETPAAVFAEIMYASVLQQFVRVVDILLTIRTKQLSNS